MPRLLGGDGFTPDGLLAIGALPGYSGDGLDLDKLPWVTEDGVDGLAPVRTWCFRAACAEVLVTGRGAGSLCSVPDCRDLGRCSGNHLREPPCRLSQALRGISGHGFRRSSA